MADGLSNEFEKRLQDKPDKWTLAWWNEQFREVLQGYRGATHGIHLALADNEDLGKSLREALERIAALEAAAELDRAKIGELCGIIAGFTEEIPALKARVVRQGEFLNTLKQKNGAT